MSRYNHNPPTCYLKTGLWWGTQFLLNVDLEFPSSFANSWTKITALLGNCNDLSTEKAPWDRVLSQKDVLKGEQRSLAASRLWRQVLCHQFFSCTVFTCSITEGILGILSSLGLLPHIKRKLPSFFFFFFPFSVTMSVVSIKTISKNKRLLSQAWL